MLVNLGLALLLAVLLVYMVMAAEFESMLDPFVVMFSVPFGITGALLALPPPAPRCPSPRSSG